MDRPTITLEAPKFELYQSVILNWNEQSRRTQIVRRWLDLDDGEGGYWWYKVAGDESRMYPENALEPAAD